MGLTSEQRQGVIELLNHDLADTYLLLIKTKKAQWDVWGPQFRILLNLWQEHCEILMHNLDSYAERARILGGYPIATAAEFLQMASIKENPEVESTTMQMVDSLLKDHEHIISSLRKHIHQCIETYNDRGTADFLVVLMERHEQMAWVLRSFLVRSFIEGENFEIEQAFPHLSQKDDVPFVSR